jgi:hypothetical protein
MGTTVTFSHSGKLHAAFFDELVKISEPQPEKPKEPVWKRRLKQGAGYALGYAAGHGAGMLVHHGVKKVMGDRFATWDQGKRMRYLAPLLGASTAIVMAANNYAQSKNEKERQQG